MINVTLVTVDAKVSSELYVEEFYDVPIQYGQQKRTARIMRVTLHLESTGKERWSGSGKYVNKDGSSGQVNYRSYGLPTPPTPVASLLRIKARTALVGAGRAADGDMRKLGGGSAA